MHVLAFVPFIEPSLLLVAENAFQPVQGAFSNYLLPDANVSDSRSHVAVPRPAMDKLHVKLLVLVC